MILNSKRMIMPNNRSDLKKIYNQKYPVKASSFMKTDLDYHGKEKRTLYL